MDANISERDYFALKAMQSLMEKYPISLLATDLDRDIIYKSFSKNAYSIADEMLKARDAK